MTPEKYLLSPTQLLPPLTIPSVRLRDSFLLVLILTSPSATQLVNIVMLVDVDQGPIVGYLNIAYLMSLLMAVASSLRISIIQRAWV